MSTEEACSPPTAATSSSQVSIHGLAGLTVLIWGFDFFLAESEQVAVYRNFTQCSCDVSMGLFIQVYVNVVDQASKDILPVSPVGHGNMYLALTPTYLAWNSNRDAQHRKS